MIKICSLYVLVTLSIFSIAITSFQANGVEEIWEDYENMEDMVKDIRNGDKDDDKVDYEKFKDSIVYKNGAEDLRDCIDLANKVGEKLGDYEIVLCFENTNYFEEKYTDNEETKNREAVNRQEQNKQEQAEQDSQNQTLNEAMANTSQQQQQQQEVQEQEQQELDSQNQTLNEAMANTSQQQQEVQEQEQQELDSQNQTLNEAMANTSQQQQQEVQEQEQQELDSQNQTLNEAEEDSGPTQRSQSDSNPQEGCDSSYPEICITTYSAKLSCGDIPFRNFKVLLPDPHGFDSDGDGIGCEG
jgi:DNA polymerase III gamma/tau subunit